MELPSDFPALLTGEDATTIAAMPTSLRPHRRRLLTALTGLAASGLHASPAGAQPLPGAPAPFGHGDFARLTQATAARPTIVHLWGISCAPCLVELPRWAAFLRQHPGLPVVFIQFDPLPAARVVAALRRARLAGGDQRSVSGPPDERLRYEIDPAWQGELPYTLLLGAGERRVTLSGSADFGQLAAWWREQPPAGQRRVSG